MFVRLLLSPTTARQQSLAVASTGTASDQPVTMSLNKRIGFVGSGQMAEALARGLIAKGVVNADQMCCSDPNQSRKDLFQSIGITPFESNLDVSAF